MTPEQQENRKKLRFLYDDAVFKMAPYFTNLGWFMFGVLTGAAGMFMAWQDVESKPKLRPAIVERSVMGKSADLGEQIRLLNAKVEAHYTQQMQRQKEVRFKTEKLELAKQVHDTQLVTAQDGADHIRQIARELGVTKIKVTP